MLSVSILLVNVDAVGIRMSAMVPFLLSLYSSVGSMLWMTQRLDLSLNMPNDSGMKLNAHNISLASSKVFPKKNILTLSLLLLNRFSSWLTNEYKILKVFFSPFSRSNSSTATLYRMFGSFRKSLSNILPLSL